MIEPFVLVDSRMTVAAARKRLARYAKNPVRVVLRRRVRLRDVWHSWSGEGFLRLLDRAADETLLRDVPDLEAASPVPTLDLAGAEPEEAERFEGVLLLDGEVVGVRIPPVTRSLPVEPLGFPGFEGPYPVKFEVFEEEELPAAPSAASPEPMPSSFPAHPRLEAPRIVAPGERFELVIGLAALRAADVHGGPIDVPLKPDGQTFELGLQVVADGFAAPEGWRSLLRGRVDWFQQAEARIPLIAPADLPEAFHLASLIIHFTHAGQTIGTAWRNVLVRRADASELRPEEQARLEEGEKPLPLGPSVPGGAPDLTVRIDKATDGSASGGRFLWTFATPHRVALPESPVAMDLGEDARTFAKIVIDEIDQNRGSQLLNGVLENLGDFIAEKVPDELWEVLRGVREEVSKKGSREVTLLLLSAECYVPWELARMPGPFVADRPPFLGAQVAMGRWILGRTGPPLPPRERVDVRGMAVIVGDYGHTARWRELPFAVEEGEALVRSYGAHRLVARADQLDALFEARLARAGSPPGVEAVHFACHGRGNPVELQSAAIILEPDGRPLTFLAVRPHALGRDFGPFVFMNACQVGTAGDVLGQYAGFAGIFLKAGARGFLAPLWSVDDQVAQRLALDLYDRAFAGVPVAEIVRGNRCQADLAAGAVTESTYLSYIFYGHPNLILSNAGAQPDAPDV